MANAKLLEVVKQGSKGWNNWRARNLGDVRILEISLSDLSSANLSGANLREIDFSNCNLSGADLSGSTLSGSNFSGANLNDSNLSGANLSGADLSTAFLRQADLLRAFLDGANLHNASLHNANLTEAILTGVDLTNATLRKAVLVGAFLYNADLNGADLTGSNLSKASMAHTILANSDLSETIGLDEVLHRTPSRISMDVFTHSKGKISEVFLRGCGLSDWEIEVAKLYNPDLNNNEFIDIQNRIYDLRHRQAIQISPLFISYNRADSEFVAKIGNCLKDKGIRYWRDIHDMNAGRVETQIDRAIRQNPTVLLILSQYSLSSDWVEHEVRTARSLEYELGRDVLCPIALDNSWETSKWEQRLMEQVKKYNILDFSEWADDVKFDSMFRKLIDGLELFYKG